MHAIVLIDKPEGLTSAEVVRRVKRLAGGKVGHLGTLDPFATGLLPLCLGEATKIAQFLNASDKVYEGIIGLGVATDTGDCTGQTREECPVPPLTTELVASVGKDFLGDLEQVPPMYSALKRDGTPLYKLARQGIEVDRDPRPIRVDRLVLDPSGADALRFEVDCSKGTYIRVLAEDIGRALGTVAHLRTLRRTGFGSFRIGDSVALEQWDPSSADGLLSIREALSELPTVSLPEKAAVAVRQGQPWVLRDYEPQDDVLDRALFIRDTGAPVAVVERSGGKWRFARVLNSDVSLHPLGGMVAPAG